MWLCFSLFDSSASLLCYAIDSSAMRVPCFFKGDDEIDLRKGKTSNMEDQE